MMTHILPREIAFGRDFCSYPLQSSSREWLITSGNGSYASGTISGALSRRYHGYLVASLAPPLGRTMLFTKTVESFASDGKQYSMALDQHSSGAYTGSGLAQLQRFYLEGTLPVWEYSAGNVLIVKKIWMERNSSRTFVSYTVKRCTIPVYLDIEIHASYRDHHDNLIRHSSGLSFQTVDNGFRISEKEKPISSVRIKTEGNARVISIKPTGEWKHHYHLSIESFRGLPASDDHFVPGIIQTKLEEGGTITLCLSPEHGDSCNFSPREDEIHYQESLIRTAGAEKKPWWIQQLVLAADQFIISRNPAGTSGHEKGSSILAGFPWFSDWGRDTMISLPGLCLATGRFTHAKSILLTYSRFVDRGMIPNRFPDAGETPEYNTVDATLWYFQAIWEYYRATQDNELLAELHPVLKDIIAHHISGTRYSIKMDEKDGLLHAGEEGVQLTWMDVKIGNWVVTPRTGKAVEINALWYNALCIMADIEETVEGSGEFYRNLAARVKASFMKFWNNQASICFDVIEGPHGSEATLRPNQLIAGSLHHTCLSNHHLEAIMSQVSKELLTSYGLKTLPDSDPEFQSFYGGTQAERDQAYHRGTIWAWLIGPYITCGLRIGKTREWAEAIITPFRDHLFSTGLGTISEIFQAEPPHPARGCFAQAWSVAEVLRIAGQVYE